MRTFSQFPSHIASTDGTPDGIDDFKPTPRSITEQFAALRKKAGFGGRSGKGRTPALGGSGSAVASPRTPKTQKPSANGTPKTPGTSASKRKRDGMSDEDDSEPEMDADGLAKNVKRMSTRGSGGKVARKNYSSLLKDDENDEDEEADDDDQSIKQETDNIDTSMFDHQLDFDGTAEKKSAGLFTNGNSGIKVANGKGPDTFGGVRNGRGKQARKHNSGDDSDVSDYNPFT